ncbi:FHA domain-containing protein [Bifidobacterium colobi]|uniref:FHA domain-containing protein n=1 Tax=Bifidobacterium colobi TaxID=2809026 RepID=UPI001BDD899C
MAVTARCGAGRMPVTARDGYDAFALLHDPSQQISRRHFEFGMTSMGQVWVMDCDSSNGTWLESHGSRTQLPKLARVSMAAGDVLRFGNMHARLVRLG